MGASDPKGVGEYVGWPVGLYVGEYVGAPDSGGGSIVGCGEGAAVVTFPQPPWALLGAGVPPPADGELVGLAVTAPASLSDGAAVGASVGSTSVGFPSAVGVAVVTEGAEVGAPVVSVALSRSVRLPPLGAKFPLTPVLEAEDPPLEEVPARVAITTMRPTTPMPPSTRDFVDGMIGWSFLYT